MLTSILSVLKRYQVTIAIFAFGLVLGFTTGWHKKSESVLKASVNATQEVRAQDAESNIKAQEADHVLTEQKEAIVADKIYIIKEIPKYVPKTVIQTVQNDVVCPSPTLSVHAVGLLNQARTGAAPDSAGLSDEEKQAPTDIGLQELAVSDSEIANMYRELAKTHDTLVDEVADFQRKQREALKK